MKFFGIADEDTTENPGVKKAGPRGPTFISKWRAGQDSNP